jgi:hypothetical protein
MARSRAQWAERIRLATARTVQALIETGQLLAAAKDELAHGEFIKMVEDDLSLGLRTVQR